MWESNPPRRLLTANTGFEDQEAHQHLSIPLWCQPAELLKGLAQIEYITNHSEIQEQIASRFSLMILKSLRSRLPMPNAPQTECFYRCNAISPIRPL